MWGSERKPYLEWSTGIEHFVSMLPMMMASLRVHVPDSQRGINIPVRQKSSIQVHYFHKVGKREKGVKIGNKLLHQWQ